MVQKTITGVKEINVAIKDVDHVNLHVRRGKGGGTKFILHTKNKKRYTLLRIPLLLMNEKNTTLIKETLQHLLHVDIKGT